MAKIPLRAYLKEIEGYIDRGEIDQAIAHAKNIIRSYPKQIDAYRLLGKSFLESQRYSEASDILQRVLSVIPDDFVSQIGMSIIREDEANLDAAIWHMERAYEVQPFNPAVQDELRRLYGRRDGVEPPKIRLTRGALVRMYLRGELYPQAIAETRAALADDPQRFDLLVLLARLYNLSNQKFEATEVCSTLISKLPFCMEANQILSEILPGTSRAEDAKKFQQRIFALDPYAAFLSPTSPTSDLVPDQAVMVEQYIWNPSDEETQTPDWTRTIGVKWEEANEEEALPDWINTLKVETPPVLPPTEAAPTRGKAADDSPSSQEQNPLSDELVPDFMKDAGWTTSDRPADEIMAEAEETETILPAEIPSWLQSIAPEQPAQADTSEEERTGWLKDILEEPAAEKPKEDVLPEMQAEELEIPPMPDWFTNTENQLDEPSQVVQPVDFAALPDWATLDEKNEPTQETTPEWLSELSQAEPLSAEPEAQIPDWLKTLETESADETPSESAIPDWAISLDEEPATAETPVIPVEDMKPGDLPAGDLSNGDHEMEDAMSWLDSLSAPEDITQPDQAAADTIEPLPAESIPEWSIAEFTTAEPETSLEEIPHAEEELPESVPQAEQIPDWLKDFGEDKDSLTIKNEMTPEWMQEEPAQSINEPSIEQNIQAEEPSLTVEGETIQGEALPAFDMNDSDAAMAWLESLAARQGADEATLITPLEQRSEIPPEWVRKEIEISESSNEGQGIDEASIPVENEAPLELAVSFLPESSEPELAEETWIGETEPVDEITEPSLELAEPLLENVEEVFPEPEDIEIPSAVIPQPEITPEAAVQEETNPAETAAPDFSDLDAAMAWLEALAARQGADEATLTTRPEDRIETPPDWVKQEMDAEQQIPSSEQLAESNQPEPEVAIPDWLAEEIETPAEPTQSAEQAMEKTQPLKVFPTEAASFEALFEELTPEESIPAGTDLEQAKNENEQAEVYPHLTPVEPVPPEEPVPAAEESFDSAFAWLDSLNTKEEPPESTLDAETLAASGEELESTQWMQQEEPTQPGTVEFLEFAQPGEETLQPAGTPSADENIESVPDWLQSIGEEEPIGSETEAWPPEQVIPPALSSTQIEQSEELPDWLQKEEASDKVEETSAPEMTEEIPDWLSSISEEETGSFALEPEPSIPAHEFRMAWEPEAEPEEPPAATPQRQSAAPESFSGLQEALARGEIDPALAGFNQIIQKGEKLTETIQILRDALYRFPVDISIWQTLGDAYARNNQLQEALDAYTKAEEFLR